MGPCIHNDRMGRATASGFDWVSTGQTVVQPIVGATPAGGEDQWLRPGAHKPSRSLIWMRSRFA